MSLKSFIVSGIQDVLKDQLGKGKSNQPAPTNNDQGMNQGYSNQQGGYGNQQPGYGNQQPGYGNQQPAYGNQQPGYGNQQPGYGNQQPGGQPGYNPYPPQGGSGYPQQNQGGSMYPPMPQEQAYPQPGGYPGQAAAAPPPIGFNTGSTGSSPYPPQGGGPGYPQGGPQGAPGYPQGGPQGAPGYPQGGPQGGSGYPQGGPGYGSGYPPAASAPAYGGQQYGQQPYGQQAMGGHQHAMLGSPSIRPVQGFNANADAEQLRKAMKGLGCNNTKVIAVLCARTNWQRQEISKAFKVMYGKDLIKDLRSELSGDFEDLILALMEPPAVYDAKQLYKAMEGLGTKESVLIEIMTSRTNQQIAEIRNAYTLLYRRNLEKDLVGETSGCFKRLLVSLCAGGRDEGNYVDALRANQDARNLYKAGERKLGTDESTFNAILASQNFTQLRMVFDEYEKVAKHSIEKAIESEFSGDIRDGLLAVISVVRNRPAYFAKLLHDSMKGLGTRDNDLIRLVVTRAEYDMVDIRNAFQAMYKTTLENMIKGDCSGSYKDGLMALVKGN